MKVKTVVTVAALLVLLTIGGVDGIAQTQNAQVNGTIMDQQGAVIPGASVTVTNASTQVSRTVTTSAGGIYVITNLQPGIYRLEVSNEGFQRAQSNLISLEVNQIGTVDISLVVGAVTETIEVVAEAAELQSTSAQLGTVVSEEKITDLPLNARNFTQLLTLTPGATPVSVAQNRNGSQLARVGVMVFPAINGQTNRSNSFTLDGVYNNNHYAGTYALAPNIDALSQFKVQAHSDQAEFGGAAGGVVNIVSRSGTNEFHGTGYWFLRNDALDARGFFTANKPVLRQNQFGATVGGPIVEDKTFFFFSYEGYRQRNPSARLFLVPTTAERGGDFSATSRRIFDPFTTRPNPDAQGNFIRDPFLNNTIPASQINNSTKAWMDEIVPSPIDTGDPRFNGRNTSPQSFPSDQYSIKVDHNFSDTDMVWFRYTWGEQNTTQAQVFNGTSQTRDRPSKNLGANYTHLFGTNTLLNVLFGFSSLTQDTINFVTDTDLVSQGLYGALPEALKAPSMSVPSFWGNVSSNAGKFGPDKGYQFRSDVSHVSGSHTFKFGGEYIKSTHANAGFRGTFAFNPRQTGDPGNPGGTGLDIASFLLGVHDNWQYSQRVFGLENNSMNFFVQDSWKATDKLTLNFGLRVDYIEGTRYTTNIPSTWDFNTGKFIVGAPTPPQCSDSQLAPCLLDPNNEYNAQFVDFTGTDRVRQNRTLWGPRFGFAYRVQPTLVLRGGFGIVYDLYPGTHQQAQNISGGWPGTGLIRGLGRNRTVVTETTDDPFNGGDPRIPAATPARAAAFMFDPRFDYPYSSQWNFSIQKQLPTGLNLTVGYVGSTSIDLAITGTYNTALTPGPGPIGPRSLWPHAPRTDYDRSIGRSNYHGLQVKAERRFSGGFSYLLAYTWSKSIDIASSGQFGVEGQHLQNPYDPNSARAVSGFDIPQNFSAAWVYELPFGRGKPYLNSGIGSKILGNWQFNGIIQLRSGQPFTPRMNIDTANIGATRAQSRALPNLVGNPRLSNPTPNGWFDTAAYAPPSVFTFGSAGRHQVRTDPLQNFDLSFFRQDQITERLRMQFRVEMFNTFNHPTFGIPQLNFTNRRFGQVSSTVGRARQIQLGIKLIF